MSIQHSDPDIPVAANESPGTISVNVETNLVNSRPVMNFVMMEQFHLKDILRELQEVTRLKYQVFGSLATALISTVGAITSGSNPAFGIPAATWTIIFWVIAFIAFIRAILSAAFPLIGRWRKSKPFTIERMLSDIYSNITKE